MESIAFLQNVISFSLWAQVVVRYNMYKLLEFGVLTLTSQIVMSYQKIGGRSFMPQSGEAKRDKKGGNAS